MPNKCVCGADATVSVAELGDALQRAAVAMYPRCPTIRTTCFHIILKSALPAPEPMPSVSAEDLTRPPTVPPSPATGHAPSGSLGNGSTAGSANNNSTEATVEDPDVEFAPLHRQVFATRKLASHAARTVDGRFVSIPGRQSVYACSSVGCDTKRYVRHDLPTQAVCRGCSVGTSFQTQSDPARFFLLISSAMQSATQLPVHCCSV